MEKCHFSGWATRNDLLCGDGRTIRKDAFKDNDGATVPLIWNHDHSSPDTVLGHALLENRDEGVYAYCTFNDSESGVAAKKAVENGDLRSLSIYANKLQQIGRDVVHGCIRELSLVMAGANPGAYIDFVMAHGDDEDDGFIANYDESTITVYHSEEKSEKTDKDKKTEDEPAKEEKSEKSEKTVQEIIDSMNEEQKNVMYAMVGEALKAAGNNEDDDKDEDEKSDDKENVKHSEGGEEIMKNNVFDTDVQTQEGVLTHADQEAIIDLAKGRNVGTLQHAIDLYTQENETLAHGFEAYEPLFPEYKDVKPGAPELLERDYGWVGVVMKGIHKSPISRIRTRQADARAAAITAKGYKKGTQKTETGKIKLINRTTDPQTVYIKDSMHRDDIIDITDFDVVEYQYGVMRRALDEKLAIAAMIGDGLEDGDPDKISEEHIRPIWTDDDLYTIHADVDFAAARAELQGDDTGAHFGENYIYAEAIITAALYARESYKGSGNLMFFCTPHLLNIMLLARDLNGRRIYNSKADLAAALNVSAIHTAEQFEGRTRTTTDGAKKKLLGLFVNLNDYHFGSTKGGEITRFQQFDIDFNQEKYLIETRLSGAMVNVYSAIALEEPVNE